jgi:1,4-alpha-glucan branching enzyme
VDFSALLRMNFLTYYLEHQYAFAKHPVIGAPVGGEWAEVLNSDAPLYGGSGLGNFGGVIASPLPAHGRPFSLSVTLPPLSVVVFQPAAPGEA